jgi:hypothetical protein
MFFFQFSQQKASTWKFGYIFQAENPHVNASVENVCAWLEKNGLKEYCGQFRGNLYMSEVGYDNLYVFPCGFSVCRLSD